MSKKSFLGFGLGLRSQHYQEIIDTKPKLDWFEIISENYMVSGGKPRYYLEKIRNDYPLVMHGVSMSIGSVSPPRDDYLAELKQLILDVQPEWVSDHLCFAQVGAVNSHDLLPLPYTEETLQHLAERIHQVQDFLGTEMVFENVSSYLTYRSDEMREWEFLAALTKTTGCRFLLDINNVYVSSRNHNFDPLEYLDAIPTDSVQQLHLAGHSDFGSHVIDTHDHPVCDPVWELYEYYVNKSGPISTLLERDDNIPALDELLSEVAIAREIAEPFWKGQRVCAHA